MPVIFSQSHSYADPDFTIWNYKGIIQQNIISDKKIYIIMIIPDHNKCIIKK